MAEQLKGAIWNNLGCLFLFKNQMTGAQVLFVAMDIVPGIKRVVKPK